MKGVGGNEAYLGRGREDSGVHLELGTSIELSQDLVEHGDVTRVWSGTAGRATEGGNDAQRPAGYVALEPKGESRE